MLNRDEYREIYEMFDRVSPFPYDCGKRCNSICCRADAFPESHLFLYIFPGEEALHDQSDPWLRWEVQRTKDHYIPSSWGESFLTVSCHGPETCKRSLRPIQCRSFPLEPHLTPDGRLQLIYCNFYIPYTCPIIREKLPFSREYLENVYAAWKKLMSDPLIWDYVKEVSDTRTSLALENQLVYEPEQAGTSQ